MGFEVYEGAIPENTRPGRGVSDRTQEVLDALAQSAFIGKPVSFTWVVADGTEANREKSRIRGIAWQHGFSCSLWVKDSKVILKAAVKEGEEDSVAREMVTVLSEAAEEAKPKKTASRKAAA